MRPPPGSATHSYCRTLLLASRSSCGGMLPSRISLIRQGNILLPFGVLNLIESLAAGVLHVLAKARMVTKEFFRHIPDRAVRAIGEPDPQIRVHEQDAVRDRVQCCLQLLQRGILRLVSFR